MVNVEMAQAIENELAEGIPTVGFKRLSGDAVIPTKAHPTDSGFDLCSAEDVFIYPEETIVIKTGIAVELPNGFEAQVRPRSGVTSKTKLRVQLGTIDNGYSGEIGVIVDNITSDDFGEGSQYVRKLDGQYYRMGNIYDEGTHLVQKGDRIAQLVITQLPEVTSEEVFDIAETERGGNGFGSSGITTEEVVE